MARTDLPHPIEDRLGSGRRSNQGEMSGDRYSRVEMPRPGVSGPSRTQAEPNSHVAAVDRAIADVS